MKLEAGVIVGVLSHMLNAFSLHLYREMLIFSHSGTRPAVVELLSMDHSS